jgi:hypothetical protein
VAHDPSDWSIRLELQEVHHPLLGLYPLQVGETGIHENAEIKNLSEHAIHLLVFGSTF